MNFRGVVAVFKAKRVYDAAEKTDGFRVLVDRLWPRGVSKSAAKIDLWLKEVAPSDALRKWFSHDPAKWPEFRKKYAKELEGKRELVDKLRGLEKKNGVVTLLYSARDENRNNAVVLLEALRQSL